MDDKIHIVCHKCCLPRSGVSINGVRTPKIDILDYCNCMSQSTFDFETILRSESECLTLASEMYNTLVELFTRQNRDSRHFDELKRRYGKVV